MVEHPIPYAYWVTPGKLLAGPYPARMDQELTRERLAALLDAGVTVFVNLTERGERPDYLEPLEAEATRRGVLVQHHRLPIPDFDVPHDAHMVRILDTIDAAIAAGRTVYVHCMGGIGRTGTVVGCYLVRHGLVGDEALAEIARLLHAGSPETETQRRMVRRWQAGQ